MTDGEDEEAPYVRIRVSPEQKRRWREYAEEHHYGTISGLVREAVENTIDDEWVLQSDSSVSVDHSELGIDEIKDEMETLNAKIDDLITHGMGVEDDELSHDELMELSTKCEDRLPVVRDEEHLRAIWDLMMDHRDPLDVKKTGLSALLPITSGRTSTRSGRRLSIWSQLGLHVSTQSSSRAFVTGTSKTLMQRCGPE